MTHTLPPTVPLRPPGDASPAPASTAFVAAAIAAISGGGASPITPSQITADQNNYSPTGLSTATILRLSSDAYRTITGLATGASGRSVLVFNIGSFPIILAAESASSTAANRFSAPTDVSLAPNTFATVTYDNDSTRWRISGTFGVFDGSQGAVTTIASASTCDVGASATARVSITGTTTITSLGAKPNRFRIVSFTGALTLTYNATTLILPGAASITTAAGDVALLWSDASGNWTCLSYQRSASPPKAISTSGNAIPLLDGVNTWSGQQAMAAGTLTDAATITWDGTSNGQEVAVTLAGNRTMAAVSNVVEGATYALMVAQDATGSRTLSWTTTGAGSFDFGVDGAPTLSTTASAVDILYFKARTINSTRKLRFLGIKKGFS